MPRNHFNPMSPWELYLRRKRHYCRKHGQNVDKINIRLKGLILGRMVG